MRRYHAFLDGWKVAIGETFDRLYTELTMTGQYRGLAALCEAEGASYLFNCATDPEESLETLLVGIFRLIEAGYWHRSADEPLLARNSGERALHELQLLFPAGRLQTARPHGKASIEWYIREIMGDAAVLVEPELARSYYQQARVGYAHGSKLEHDSDKPNWFPGGFMLHLLDERVPGTAHLLGHDERIDRKIELLTEGGNYVR